MNNTYKQIWNYLEGKLSTKEEDELMDWIAESERNTVFFDQTVQDFNQFNQLSPAQKPNLKWYWAAASLLVVISVSIILFKSVPTKYALRDISLVDGSELVLAKNTQFEFDSLSFSKTKWIKINGTAQIRTPQETHLLVELQSGYLIMEGKSSLQIQTLKNNDIKVLVSRGKIRWLNPSSSGEEISMMSGEKVVFKNDGKTILLNSSEKRQNSLLIFDNYMNL
ncbi:hypothetical protein [uncultured Marivirga sp.]|uniref:hypothetical protein n=1 Tax=uncultured Marivirga sp. TaxID=1123707 RepID=UPI0030EE3B8B|tara:strand:+ start:336322 stop:336990 length:669 start_codon:yes stop_codon:yes gene_type:complete